MTIITDDSLPMQLRNSLFSLEIVQKTHETTLLMHVYTPILNTHAIPQTYSLLQKNLPQVLSSRCFNEDGLPFHVEVQHTEIGHLFEHILLEYLCQQKLSTGCKQAVFSGVTDWNWKKDTRGIFHITVNVGSSEAEIFFAALEKSVALLNLIISQQDISNAAFSALSKQNVLRDTLQVEPALKPFN
jgi:hypothetical protein